MPDRASVYSRQSSGKAKSISEQLAAGTVAIRHNGWEHVGDYSDGTGASRFGTKKRSEWERVLTDLAADVFDILVLWESSRGDRTLSSWAEFLELCRKHRVRVHVIADDHTYDLNRPRDWKTLASAGVDAASETDVLSIRTRRGHAGAAAAGFPPGGPTPFGYRRTFDPATGKRVGQQPHPGEAATVAEIFRRVGRGDTILGLANELNRRGTPWRGRVGGWTPSCIRTLVRNRAYLGIRVHDGTEYPGTWEPLVSEAVFYGAQTVLNTPGRRITRPGRQKYLLSYLGRCGPCGGWLNQVSGCYRCRSGCVSIPRDPTDEAVTDVILGRLTGPDARTFLDRAGDDEAGEAQAQVGVLRLKLDEWRASAARGETSPASLAVVERELCAQIEVLEAKAQARVRHFPPLLQDLLDPAADVSARWGSATVPGRRAVIKALCEVTVGVGVPGRRSTGVSAKFLALARLGGSRWVGDDRTWAQIWQP